METSKNSLNSSADKMLNEITSVINNAIKYTPRYSGAIVSRVNENGTVNVYFPPDNNTIFTNISNQTPFALKEGDSVEIVLKDGSYNNCWIVAKHSDTSDIRKIIREEVISILRENNLIL